MVDFNQMVQKAKDFASKNPDKVRQGIEKAEELVNNQTGGKYGSQIESAGEQVEKQLGVPADGTNQAAQDSNPSQPAPNAENPGTN